MRFIKWNKHNLHKLPPSLPEQVKGPAILAPITETDKKAFGTWGHSKCSEAPYGQTETSLYIKAGVTPKVGSNWRAIVAFERGKSMSQSAMYGGSLREMSFEEIVEARGKKS